MKSPRGHTSRKIEWLQNHREQSVARDIRDADAANEASQRVEAIANWDDCAEVAPRRVLKKQYANHIRNEL